MPQSLYDCHCALWRRLQLGDLFHKKFIENVREGPHVCQFCLESARHEVREIMVHERQFQFVRSHKCIDEIYYLVELAGLSFDESLKNFDCQIVHVLPCVLYIQLTQHTFQNREFLVVSAIHEFWQRN